MTQPTYEKDSHCSYCGHPFAPQQRWPRLCAQCGQTSYRNPLPVGVAIVPVLLPQGGRGVLAIQRQSGRKRGLLALPGGYIEAGESWQVGMARELAEEANVAVTAEGITLFQLLSAPDGTLLIFGLTQPVRAADLPPFRPSNEVSDRVVLSAPLELAFPLHTKVLADYFGQAP